MVNNSKYVYRDNVGTAITATESNIIFEGNLHSEISKPIQTSYFPKLKLKLNVHPCQEGPVVGEAKAGSGSGIDPVDVRLTEDFGADPVHVRSTEDLGVLKSRKLV